MERAFNEKNKTESANYAEEYIRNFLTKEPIPGIANEEKYYKELLPQITVDDVNAVAEKLDKIQTSLLRLPARTSYRKEHCQQMLKFLL